MLIKELLKEQESFSEIEKSIANYFLNEKENIKKEGIRKIAKKLYVAPSSIVRFCQKIGFEGLNEFKEQYVEELRYMSSNFQKINPNKPFEVTDDELEVSDKILSLYQETINDTRSLFQSSVLKEASLMLDKETIYILTLSAQQGISMSFQEKMRRIGKRVVVLKESHEIFFEIEHANPEKCAFLIISYTGESEHCIICAQKALEKHHNCVAITSYGINQLSTLVNCSIRVSSKEKLVSNLGDFSFAISVMYVLDVLYSNIFNLRYEKNKLLKKESSSQDSQPSIVPRGRRSNNPLLSE
ncbi:MAG: MurR/RpiR family transcriptional regulator [Bacillota bacterium]|nr:MurR/RpiR family transcriptional regulator [Bacillota bacterium]